MGTGAGIGEGSASERTRRRLAALLDELDELVERDADLRTVVQRTAAILDADVGVHHAAGPRLAAGPGGPLEPAEVPGGARTRTLPGGTIVWFAGDSLPVDGAGDDDGLAHAGLTDTALRRFGVAVKAALRQPAASSRPDALRIAVDGTAGERDRVSALRRLGLRPDVDVTLIAVSGPPGDVGTLLGRIRRAASTAHHLVDRGVHLVLAADVGDLTSLDVPVGLRAAFTPAEPAIEAPAAWRAARRALRFALPSTHARGPYGVSEAVFVNSTALGGYALLAELLRPEHIAQERDVQLIGELYQESGQAMLLTLEAVAATDSLRKAARSVHLHHNSVAHRVERAEKVLGFRLTEPYGRTRLFLALVLRRLLDSAHLA